MISYPNTQSFRASQSFNFVWMFRFVCRCWVFFSLGWNIHFWKIITQGNENLINDHVNGHFVTLMLRTTAKFPPRDKWTILVSYFYSAIKIHFNTLFTNQLTIIKHQSFSFLNFIVPPLSHTYLLCLFFQ